jgi:hypothetical protein
MPISRSLRIRGTRQNANTDLCARASSRRVVVIAPDRRLWRPSVTAFQPTAGSMARSSTSPASPRPPSRWRLALRQARTEDPRLHAVATRVDRGQRLPGPVAMAGLHAVEAVAALGWDRGGAQNDRVHPVRAEARHHGHLLARWPVPALACSWRPRPGTTVHMRPRRGRSADGLAVPPGVVVDAAPLASEPLRM